jgi:hypothetical protein
MNLTPEHEGLNMLTICKRLICVLFLVLIAGPPLGCLTIGGPPDKDHHDVNVGGDKGVNVDHQDKDHGNDQH